MQVEIKILDERAVHWGKAAAKQTWHDVMVVIRLERLPSLICVSADSDSPREGRGQGFLDADKLHANGREDHTAVSHCGTC